MSDEQTEVLGSQNIALDGPFKIEMQVCLKIISGEHEGMQAWATIDLPPGTVPTEEMIITRLKTAMDSGDAFRLATRKEFVTELLCEKIGYDMNFSVPGPKDFRLNVAPTATA